MDYQSGGGWKNHINRHPLKHPYRYWEYAKIATKFMIFLGFFVNKVEK